jgi:hypothetical protein
MPSQITVTGKIGPGLAATALVLQNLNSFSVDTDKKLLTVVQNGFVTEQFDIAAATTMTVTISAGTFTVVVS